MKSALRTLFKARLRTLSEEERERGALALLSLPIPPEGDILSFMSIGNEISTHALNVKLLDQGRLLLPKVTGESLSIYKVHSFDELVVGPFGILEPLPREAGIPVLMIIPGLAFDERGHRLGYGRGFYDRLIASHPTIPTMGVGFSVQQTALLPTEEHDKPLTECFFPC